ncbi:hypothetical protein B1992_01705 [Pseudoxanthomonas broegbernensis]|uniref:Lipoprotein n=1 Tax=Pseudoxanthomonas broegbernensis TaxID=83619 RepID=A0A7V8K8T3_9GAMM|nr:DUF6491 family protein [Pseudoxanthomonas broegbernensis]KAF1688157.1 hypothetical protein B1992_01705 [Pseudoxanthomonas broegbernensis]MBB6065207.1 hypothetical protein [Pseudoxanthomonas broegbernensis]
MKKMLAVLALAVAAGCSSAPRLSDAERLAMYQAHAGEPVRGFSLFGGLQGWSPLGNRAMVVWTRPNQAWLLELVGPCHDLDYATAISVTSFGGQVQARSDSVMPLGPMVGQVGRVPCRIDAIRPVDAKGVKRSEQELRQASTQPREAADPAEQP